MNIEIEKSESQKLAEEYLKDGLPDLCDIYKNSGMAEIDKIESDFFKKILNKNEI